MRRTILSRVLPATILGLCVFALLVGTLGTALADGARDEAGTPAQDGRVDGEAMPERFVLAWPRGGDTAAASIEVERLVDGQWASDAASPYRVERQWGPEEAWRGADGAWTAAHRLVEVYPDSGSWSEAGGVSIHVPAMRVSVHATATGGLLGESGSSSSSASAMGTLTGGEAKVEAWSEVAFADGRVCGLEAALRAGVPTSAPFEVVGCGDAGAARSYRAVGVESVNGVLGVRFESVPADTQPGEAAEPVRVAVYAPAIPFPLREAVSGKAVRTTETLTGFSVGDQAWDTGLQVPDATRLPLAALAERQPWGPDDAGLDHPFPLSAAWQGARDALAFPDFRAFLAEHPGAVAVEASFQETHQDASVTRSWRLLVGDGEAAGYLEARQSSGPVGAIVFDTLGRPAPTPAASQEGYAWQQLGGHSGFETAALPQRLPTAASVLAFADAWAASSVPAAEGPANAWGLLSSYGLGDMRVVAGRDVRERGPDGLPVVPDTPAGESRWEATMLAFDASGAPSGVLLGMVWTKTTTSSPLGPAPKEVAQPPGSDLDAPEGFVLAGLAWAAPSGPVATGAGLLSLASALLYYAWPALKGGALGLFTRVQGPRVLEHPTRRAILDAVAAQPGIHLQALGRLLGAGNGTVEHHVRRLVAQGFLTRHAAGKYVCLFPGGQAGSVQASRAAAVKSDGARRILDAVRGNPGASATAVCLATGLDAGTVSYHVGRLRDAGLLRADRVGRSLSLRAA